jgi:hypothetical protein
VIKELEEETIFWFSLSFLPRRTLLHQLWIIFTLLMMYFASSMYFRVIYPRNTFWIFIAAWMAVFFEERL